jgi:NAD(P)-dependent dehydrogenase (short-subunit alcohol dehydrogenase family)
VLLEDKNAVIYGGGGKVGGVVARAFAREGARVFLASRTLESLEEVAGQIRSAGRVADTAQVDALDERAVDEHLEQAKAAAGDKDVSVAGGANIIQQFIRAGLLDEIHIHLVPVLLGDGVRLFDHLDTEQIELETTRVIESSGVTHLGFYALKEN